jgi:pantoate--beta-alanine ligase
MNMKVITFSKDLLTLLASMDYQNGTIGFVPTMGALHRGHASLIEQAASECDHVITSIFVNPTQFNENEDFINYPKKPTKDLEILESAGCDLVFMPETDQIYDGTSISIPDLGSIESVMEGSSRPGHFNGVKEVVTRLFNLTKPHKAYFGEKDFQQLAVIRALSKTLSYKVVIVGCPTIREDDGLAMSSRNIRLTKEERDEAGSIYKALQQAVLTFKKEGSAIAEQKFKSFVEDSGNFNVEYISCVNSDDLQPIANFDANSDQRILTAVMASQTRLIDNISV